MHLRGITKLLAALVVFLVVAFAVTRNGPLVFLGVFVALAFAAWWLFLEQRRRSSASAPTRTGDNDSTSRTERPVGAARNGGAAKPTVEDQRVRVAMSSDKRTAPREVSGQDRLSPLRSQLQHIPNMSGPEFERYMASVFEALATRPPC